MHSIFIQILYCLIMFLIALSTNYKYILKSISNSGLWIMIMCDLTIICLSHPNEPNTLFFFPCRISAKFYPIALFILFTCINNFIINY